jgi:hypothetical protein
VIWAAVAATCVGCYLLKLAGFTLPTAVLERDAVRRVADLLPVALLASLVVVQALTDGRELVVDARLAGVAAAGAALLLRAPFLVVVVVAAATAALLRAQAG